MGLGHPRIAGGEFLNHAPECFGGVLPVPPAEEADPLIPEAVELVRIGSLGNWCGRQRGPLLGAAPAGRKTDQQEPGHSPPHGGPLRPVSGAVTGSAAPRERSRFAAIRASESEGLARSSSTDWNAIAAPRMSPWPTRASPRPMSARRPVQLVESTRTAWMNQPAASSA